MNKDKSNKSKYYGSVHHVADLALVDIQCQLHFVEECRIGKSLNIMSPRVMRAFNNEMYRLAKNN